MTEMLVEHKYIIDLCYTVIFEPVLLFWLHNDNVLYHFMFQFHGMEESELLIM